jgi:hypothetical protein
VRRRLLFLPCALLLAPAALAQEAEVPTTADLDAIAGQLPTRPWYPEGYYDLRIAAEAQIADYPRPDSALLQPATAAAPARFDLLDCNAEPIDRNNADMATLRFGMLALEMARLRSEFARLGYPAPVYGDALVAYEKAVIERIIDPATRTPENPRMVLAAVTETDRQRLAPTLPPIVSSPSCFAVSRGGSSGSPGIAGAIGGLIGSALPRPKGVTLRTEPVGGELLLINAFAFKVCMRKQKDPWDRMACRWNETETGVANPLSGRFVYQVKWPDGAVRKGTREIAPEQSGAVTFKKVGS